MSHWYSASVTLPGSERQRGFHMSRIAPPNAVESSPMSHLYEASRVPALSLIVTFTGLPSASWPFIRLPWSSVVFTDGIVIVASTPDIVVGGCPTRTFAMTAPIAPAFWAFLTLIVKLHVPRLISAIFPASAAPFVIASQPSLTSGAMPSIAMTTSAVVPVPVSAGPNCAPPAGHSPGDRRRAVDEEPRRGAAERRAVADGPHRAPVSPCPHR